MVYFVATFLALGLISLALFVGFAAVRASAKLRRGLPFWTAGVRRSLLMAVLWLGAAAALHGGMMRSGSFAAQMPALLLRWDLRHALYGPRAIAALADRGRQRALDRDACRSVTDALLAAEWWRDETWGKPFDAARPAQAWLTLMVEQALLADEQFARWIELVPPPIFGAAALGVASDPGGTGGGAETPQVPPLVVTAWFGREWQRVAEVPYEVVALRVHTIRVNGAAQEFQVEEAPDSQAALRRFATKVDYRFTGLRAPAAPGGDGVARCEIEVDYALDIEPGGYADIGSLTWRTTLILN